MSLIEAIRTEDLEKIKDILSQVTNNIRKINAIHKSENLTLKIFQYMYSFDKDLFDDKLLEYIVNHSIINGHLELYNYIHIPIKTSVLIPEVAKKGHLEVLKYLISLGKVNSFILENAVLLAAENGHIEIVKYLVSLGVYFETTIKFAVKSGDLNLVKYLITVKLCKEVAFQYACEFGNLEIIKYLISLGYPLQDEKDNIVISASNGHFEIVKYFCEYGKIFFKAKYLSNAAASSGHLHIVQYICDFFDIQGFDLDIRRAAINGHLEVVKYLYSKGVLYNDSALFLAAEMGHFQIVKFLVENGLKIKNGKNKEYYENDIFVMAAINGHFEIVKFLHITAKPDIYRTHYMEEVMKNGHYEVAKYLYENGVEIQKNYQYESMISRNYKFCERYHLLRKDEEEDKRKSSKENLLLVDSHLL